ncbi:beta strand repeat-containing protein [Variovorax sp. RHLX14]|uniref:beta strand repeat-containing protein n=1 Tax=Variovorax sp. RHLX14 TaxID=1259731 RepID=UPI003F4961F5
MALYGLALGVNAAASGSNSVAIGVNSSTAGENSVALGQGTNDNGALNGTVLGAGANIAAGRAGNNVALGANASAVRGSSASFTGYALGTAESTVGELSIGSAGNTRQLTNLAAGTASTDGVNVSQLAAVGGNLAVALGGGSSFNAASGAFTAPSYSVGGVVRHDVGSALAATNALGVQYVPNGSGAPTASVDLTKGNTLSAVTISGVAPGAVSVTSADAVNGSQLYATNLSVATLSNSIDRGAIGPLQYSGSGTPTVSNGGIKSNDMTLIGASASVAVGLHNVSAGLTTAGSTDAVNGGQLNTVLASVATHLGGGAVYDPASGKVVAPSYTVDGNTYDNVGDALANVDDSVSGGAGVKYYRTNSTLGDSVASGVDSTAVGGNAVASGIAAIALGRNTLADTASAVAIGDAAVATGGKAVSIGAGNRASGNGAVAIGDPNNATGTGSVAVGADNTAVGDGAVAAGNLNVANGSAAIAMGTSSTAVGVSAMAFGASATAAGQNAMAFGSGSNAAGIGTIAIGSGSNSSSTNSVAIGAGSNVSVAGSVALGASSSATRGASGSYTAYGSGAGQFSAGEVSLGSAGSARQLTNLAPGSAATDGVNVGQLTTSVNGLATNVASVLGGTVNASTGAYAGTTYNTANGSTATTVQGGFDSYNTAITGLNNGGAGPVQFSDPGTPTVRNGGTRTNDMTLVGVAAGPVGLHNVRSGSTAVASTDAINGGQLNTGLASVATSLGGGSAYDPVTGKLTAPSFTVGGTTYNNAGAAFAAVNNSVANGAGIKYFHANSAAADAQAQGAESVAIGAAAIAKYAGSIALGSGSETDAAAPAGLGFVTATAAPASELSVGTATAQRRITNVAAGSAGTDAVNVSQLGAVTGNINSAIGQTVFNALTGAAVAPSFTVGGQSYNNLTSTVSAIDSGLTATNAASAALLGAINGGTVGLLKQVGGAPGTGILTVGAATGGTVLNVAGTAGNRVISGVAAGVAGSDAATVAQVAAAGTVAANTWITASTPTYAAPSASGVGSMAVGNGATSTGTQSVAIGENASDGGRNSVVSVGSAGAERQIANVAAGTASTDAANVRQVGDLAAKLGGGAQVLADGTVQGPTYTIDNYTTAGTLASANYGNVGDAIGGLSGSIVNLSAAVKTVTSGGGTYVQSNTTGAAAQATGIDSLAMGPGATSIGESSIAMGSGSNAAGKGAVALGLNSTAVGLEATAVGATAKAIDGGTALGSNADASVAQRGTAIGNNTVVKADGGVALGAGSVAERVGLAGAKEAMSGAAVASTQGAISVGTEGGERQIVNVAGGTKATDAVNVRQLQAVQAGSTQYERNSDGSVNYGKLVLGDGQSPNGTVVSNVAPGVAGTDAVNVNQLGSAQTATNSRIDAVNNRVDSVARNAYAGVASAMAVQMPGSSVPGKVAMRVGSAVFKGESAIGVSFRRTSQSNAWTVTGGVGLSRAGAAATVGAEWIFD